LNLFGESLVGFALMPGNVADITMAIPLLGAVDKPKRLLADKAYDADSFRNWLKRRKIKAVIPSTATRRTPYPLDQMSYRRRNVIERMFCKLKNWRRIATRLIAMPKTTSQDSHSPPSSVSGFK
jgi:transposase